MYHEKNCLLCFILLGLFLLFVGCSSTISLSSSSSASQSSYSYSKIEPPSTTSMSSSSSAPSLRSYCITYSLTLQSNPSVGHDWGTTVTCNGNSIRSGEIITGAVGSYITIRANVTEYDSIPDRGSGSLRVRLMDGVSDSVTISVKENRGRYAGNTAQWKFTCTIKEQ